MSSHPYQSSSSVLDAAALGETLPNFDAVGALLVDLGHTTPLGAGEALRSTAVAAAAKVSRRGSRLLALKALKSLFIAGTVALSSVALVTDQGPAPATDHAPAGSDAPSGLTSPGYEPVSILTGLESSSSLSLTAGPDLGPGPGLGFGDAGEFDNADDGTGNGDGPAHLAGGTEPPAETSNPTPATSNIDEDQPDADHPEDEDGDGDGDKDKGKDEDEDEDRDKTGNKNESQAKNP